MISFPRNTCAWVPGGTETFRNQSRKLITGQGSNLQNPSDNICTLYIPDPGKIFLQGDGAGAEALIVAYLCPAGNFRELFIQGIKPHTFVAMHIFARDWMKEGFPEVQKWIDLDIASLKQQTRWKEFNKYVKESDATNNRYFIGKKSCHSFNYRKQPSSFIFDVLKESEGRVVLTKKEGERIHSIYHSLFPEIEQRWHRDIDEQVSRTKILFNLFGYPREFYGPITPALLREATAWVPQSTVGVLTNRAFTWMQSYIEGAKLEEWDLLNNKHDSLLMQVPDDEENINHCRAKLIEFIGQELVSPRGEKFLMKVEVSCGMNWGKHSEKNTEGLREI